MTPNCDYDYKKLIHYFEGTYLKIWGIGLIFVLVSQAAFAERYIVMMKAEAPVFAGRASFEANLDGEVVDRLHNLNSYIVNTKSEADLERLRQDPGIERIEKDEVIPYGPETLSDYKGTEARVGSDTPVAGVPWGIAAIKAQNAWALSNQGQGARILLVDSGIDKNHPYLKDNFERGKDFTGQSDGSDVADIRGHGTHVAGIIAARSDVYGFSGVAPKAKILMARACYDKGCSTAGVIAGINWGVSQKVDAMNISISGISTTPAQDEAISRAFKAGIPVVASSGNWGSDRVFYPAALPTVIAVGAVEPNLQRATFSQYGPQLALVAPGVDVYSTFPGARGKVHSVKIESSSGFKTKYLASTFGGTRQVRTSLRGELVDCGDGDMPTDYPARVKGRFALVTRGTNKLINKINTAIKAGAVAIVFVNNRPGLQEGRFGDEGSELPISIFMIEQRNAVKVRARLSAGEAITATLQVDPSGFQVLSGTSMAAPHVTGVVALMKAANKKLTAARVKQILMETAAAPAGNNTKNEYGAGFLDAEKAVKAATGRLFLLDPVLAFREQ